MNCDTFCTQFFPFAPLITSEQPGLNLDELTQGLNINISDIRAYQNKITQILHGSSLGTNQKQKQLQHTLSFMRYKLYQATAVGGKALKSAIYDTSKEVEFAVRDLLAKAGWNTEVKHIEHSTFSGYVDNNMLIMIKPIWMIESYAECNYIRIEQEREIDVANDTRLMRSMEQMSILKNKVITLEEKVKELETALLYQTGSAVFQEVSNHFEATAEFQQDSV